MAQILPSKLPRAVEYENISYNFSYSLDADETFISIKIIDHLPNDGIVVNYDNASFSGNYRNSFDVEHDALQYVVKATNETKVTNSWDDLPDPKTADLILWRAPKAMQKDYLYEVELKYNISTENSNGSTSTTTQTITSKIIQTVYGNWTIWANQLREYVNASNSN